MSSRLLAIVLLGWFAITASLSAQDAVPPADLSASQKQLLRDYQRFEKSLFDIAEQARRKDPDRAELLYRARTQSQEQKILTEMEAIAALLAPSDPDKGNSAPQYGSAADRQKELLAHLEDVLKLLQSLDDRARIDDLIKQVEENLKHVNRIIASEKDVRAETQRGRPGQQLKNAQQKVLDESDKLAQRLDQQQKEREKKSEKTSDSQSKDDNPESGQPEAGSSEENSEQSTPDNKPNESGDKPEQDPSGESEKSPSQDGQKSPAEQPMNGQQPMPNSQQQDAQPEQPQQGAPQPGTPSDQEDPAQEQQPPGREQLEQARREMQQAIEKLEQDQKENAVKNQDQAVARLEELKAELERILRQLREEEKETWLTMLEARFQNMLKRQQHINSETEKLERIEEKDRAAQNYAAQTGSLRKEQSDNALEAEKALLLLKEEGSSVAFPEAVEQMHKNMLVVVNRLGNLETGSTTQLVETLIQETLVEMIDALRQELQKQEDKKK